MDRLRPRDACLVVAMLVAALAVVAGSAQVASASHDPDVSTYAAHSETYIESTDGTELHVDLLQPKDLGAAERTPVLLMAGPYFGIDEHNDPVPVTGVGPPDSDPPRIPATLRDEIVRPLLDRRYSVVFLTLRGYGRSGGCQDYQGPGEQADVEAGVRWAAGQSWSTGKVGMYGPSSEGATQVAALARRVPGLAAAVIVSPVSDYYRSNWMNGVRKLVESVADPTGYQVLTLTNLGASPDSRFDPPRRAGCAPATIAESQNPDSDSPFWRARNLIPRALGNDVPTLWSHGFVDENVAPSQVHEIYASQTGPRRIWFGQFGHVLPTDEVAGRGSKEFFSEVRRWLDRYVKGVAPAAAPVEEDPPAVIQQGYDGRWRSEAEWPPRDAVLHEIPVRRGSYRDAPGNKGEPGFRPEDPSCVRIEIRCGPGSPQGVGTWTFTPPFPYDAHIAGVPRLSVTIEQQAPRVNVIAFLYDVDANNRAALITEGAYASHRSGTVSFDLYPQDWDIHAGHRLGILLSGADDYYFAPGTSGTSVEVTGGRLSLPFLACERQRFLRGEPSEWIKARPTFGVDPSAALVAWGFPPRLSSCVRRSDARPAMRLSISPRSTRVGQRTRFRFRASYVRAGKRRPLSRALIRFAGRRVRTDRRGRAAITVRFDRPGQRHAAISKRGFRTASVRVRILRRSRERRFPPCSASPAPRVAC